MLNHNAKKRKKKKFIAEQWVTLRIQQNNIKQHNTKYKNNWQKPKNYVFKIQFNKAKNYDFKIQFNKPKNYDFKIQFNKPIKQSKTIRNILYNNR